ncbi:hypothetical protein A8924_4551 [Saccharopolyspora erythraea NRRL 2338]|uniref:Uncharacterized protein n=2 Tax=Saccharopolyspora erythraea TaxID=1836 RepID=A4FHA2_SACEN|nr:hypothetical protein [Saccharopolyspora erythraea]EQD86874.1 hypothetical protein N599_07285 [Saccharopolyspora erythraea D]PFG97127.1 hypothetical protein A8924_4551 [Saccharopolyspora erythraea NRRL 2338]QRK87330.1 hypothetical protein JQX30_21210 [Saccharopolyspora erythraea]CAM03427.1 hypothetical protein SACE_4158 [Saccharopolyspora erythraea NRRL 2338]
MAADAGSYVMFLIVGVVLVAVDGQLIRRSGTTYLRAVYPDSKVADSVNQLITVVFHLATLGVLALISIVDVDLGSPLESAVAKLGILLLVLALAHGITIGVLAKVRARQQVQVLDEELTAARVEDHTHAPAGGNANSPIKKPAQEPATGTQAQRTAQTPAERATR